MTSFRVKKAVERIRALTPKPEDGGSLFGYRKGDSFNLREEEVEWLARELETLKAYRDAADEGTDIRVLRREKYSGGPS